MTTTRQLRKNRKCTYKNLKSFNGLFKFLKDDDLIDPIMKRQFYNKYNQLPVDDKSKMYLVRLYIYEKNQNFYKVGFTSKPLIKRLESLNNQYKSGYDVNLIDYFYVNSPEDERNFHCENSDISYPYETAVGKNQYELYDDKTIIERFNDYGDNFIDE